LKTNKFHQLTDKGGGVTWLIDSRRLLFHNEGTLYIVDRESGDSRPILSFDPDWIGNFGLSRDNRTVYFTRARVEADIWMLTINPD
jgi:hypothetical protein